MRGVTIHIEEDDGQERWCPFEYEFLHELCHCCGIIGHTEKSCAQVIRVAERWYGKWLHVLPPRCHFLNDI
jgi:hypothetical protein